MIYNVMCLVCQRRFGMGLSGSAFGDGRLPMLSKSRPNNWGRKFAKLPVDDLDFTIAGIFSQVSRGLDCVGVSEKIVEAYTVDKVHHDGRTQTERVFGSETPSLNFRDRDGGSFADEAEGSRLRSSLLVVMFIMGLPDASETDHPGCAVAKGHLHASIKRAVVEGALELIGKSLRMKGRDPWAELAPSVGFVHLVDPELGLYPVAEIDEPLLNMTPEKVVLLTEYGVRSTVWAIERNMAFCELGWSGRASKFGPPSLQAPPTPVAHTHSGCVKGRHTYGVDTATCFWPWLLVWSPTLTRCCPGLAALCR